MSFFEELVKRLSLPTPDFFKKIAKFGTFLIGLGGIMALPIIPEQAGVQMSIVIPAFIPKIGSYLIFIGMFVNRIAKLTVEDPSQITSDNPK